MPWISFFCWWFLWTVFFNLLLGISIVHNNPRSILIVFHFEKVKFNEIFTKTFSEEAHFYSQSCSHGQFRFILISTYIWFRRSLSKLKGFSYRRTSLNGGYSERLFVRNKIKTWWEVIFTNRLRSWDVIIQEGIKLWLQLSV